MSESDTSSVRRVQAGSGSFERRAGGLAAFALLFALAWGAVVTATGSWGTAPVDRTILVWSLAPFLVLLGIAAVRSWRTA